MNLTSKSLKLTISSQGILQRWSIVFFIEEMEVYGSEITEQSVSKILESGNSEFSVYSILT